MASFGSSASGMTSAERAFALLGYGSILHGYTPDNDLGERGMLAAILGSMLTDSTPAPALTVGSSTQMTKFAVYSVSLTPVTVASAAIEETTFAVTGITTGDKIFVNPPALGTAVSNCAAACAWRVTTADVIAGAFVNISASTSGKGTTGTYVVTAIRS